MKKIVFTLLALISAANFMNAQTAMQISGDDCYGNPMNIFSDLDAGKAVILHFYMPECGSCPPPAQKIQTMASNIMETYPDMIKGYAFPFQNSTDCDYSVSWVEDNDLSFYAPMDSGATPVAYYGGFGMPTVVLLGGTDHRVMFSTLSFNNSDTSEMADSIFALFGASPTLINSVEELKNLSVSPNPANASIEINFSSNAISDVNIVITDITGKIITEVNDKSQAGSYNRKFETTSFPEGIYIMRITSAGITSSKRFTVIH